MREGLEISAAEASFKAQVLKLKAENERRGTQQEDGLADILGR